MANDVTRLHIGHSFKRKVLAIVFRDGFLRQRGRDLGSLHDLALGYAVVKASG